MATSPTRVLQSPCIDREVRSGSPLSPAPRKRWSAPRLRRHGDLRSLTLGPSPGTGESGNPAIFRV